MKRRAFILLASTGAVGVAIPLLRQWEELSGWGSPFAQPRLLSLITSRKNIKSLGEKYTQLSPNESNYNVLFNLLSDTKLGSKVVHELNTNVVRSRLDGKVKDDFHSNRILVLNGWVLSITEARQCALYFLLQS